MRGCRTNSSGAARRKGRRAAWYCLLAALGAGGWGGAEEERRSPRKIIVVVRVGALAREEYSPGSKSVAPWAWRLVETGTTLIHLERAGDPTTATSLDELRAFLFPRETIERIGGEREAIVTVDLPQSEAIPHDLLSGDGFSGHRSARPPFRDLQALFGPPGAPTPAEAEAVASIDRLLESRRDDGRTPASAEVSARASLVRLQKAPAGLVRIVCREASEEQMRLRDRFLGVLFQLAGSHGSLCVVNLPESGEGTVFLAGPRFEAGRILATPVRLPAVVSLIDLLAGGAAAESQGEDEGGIIDVLQKLR